MLPHAHHAKLAVRQQPPRREFIPQHRLPLLVGVADSSEQTLVARAPEPSSSSGTTCQNGHRCTKTTSTLITTTLPVVLGAGVPLLCAIVVFIILHRRNIRRLQREDLNDKHKSLDFGMDMVEPKGPRRGGGRGPMSKSNHGKGLSLDIGHPYLMAPGMAPGLHRSRESLHSMSRSVGEDDKYHAAMFTHDNGSFRSVSRAARDDASSIAGSTSRFGTAEESNSGLLRNAQRISRSSPPVPPAGPEHSPDDTPQDYLDTLPTPASQPHGHAVGSAATDYGEHNQDNDRDALSPEPLNHAIPTPSIHLEAEADVHATPSPDFSLDDRPNFPFPDSAPYPTDSGHEQSSTIQLPRISLPTSEVTSDYGDERKSDLMIPAVSINGVEDDQDHNSELDHATTFPEPPEEPPQNLDLAYDNRRDTRRLTLGVRPLPPEDPAEDPEQRANRIRSFYKEYFDETKRETQYFEDYGAEYDYEDAGYVYDPVTGEFFDAFPHAPYAEPPTRRAMTPPPRAPPRFQGAPRHMATNSAGFNGFVPGPRAFSSASGRLPGARGPGKPLPPPSPLQNLPTPHMLTDDSIFMAADFAPGKNFRDQREGRPDTPTGGLRPFSPATRAHTPLASSFEELSPIPSAHALRKSGTFTNLDFAPPPRFKNTETASDAGSIRSNRSGISVTHQNNIRMGKYRVSRLPADMVGTKDDLSTSLRPRWDMRNV